MRPDTLAPYRTRVRSATGKGGGPSHEMADRVRPRRDACGEQAPLVSRDGDDACALAGGRRRRGNFGRRLAAVRTASRLALAGRGRARAAVVDADHWHEALPLCRWCVARDLCRAIR